MLHVDHDRWGQTAADLRHLAVSAAHAHSRERFLAAAAIVKRYAALAGLDTAPFAGHSLRSGFLTSSTEAGASVLKMVEVSRHKSIDMLTKHVRRSNLFREHAGTAFL
jgi:hypothetical protein